METKTELELENLVDKNKYQVFLLACKAHAPFGFAMHPWFVVNKKGTITRWEVRHYKNKTSPGWGHLFFNSQPPFQGIGLFLFSKKHFRTAKLVTQITGDEGSLAHKIAEFIEQSKEAYPYTQKYFVTGPNSNTYVEWVFNQFPEFKVPLPVNFIGKDYRI